MEKMRLLLADDNPHVLQMLACLLSDKDRIVGTAQDGRVLLTVAAELRPDIVISDIDMPGVNGLEATRQLRELLPHTKVILMSGHDDSDHVTRAFAAGAYAFVSKGQAGDLRTTFNEIISNALARPASQEFVAHGMAGTKACSF